MNGNILTRSSFTDGCRLPLCCCALPGTHQKIGELVHVYIRHHCWGLH